MCPWGPGGAYFVNRHSTFWKEETFSFPKHQIFLKSIKKSSRKSKKSEIFSEKNRDFSKMSEFSKNFRKFLEMYEKCMKFSEIFWKFGYFWKIMIFSGKISDFFDFRDEFFMDFKKFWCFGKENVSSFQQILCLFTKYAPPGGKMVSNIKRTKMCQLGAIWLLCLST